MDPASAPVLPLFGHLFGHPMRPPDPHEMGGDRPSRSNEEILDTAPVQDLIKRHAYKEILEDRGRFWSLFCQTVFQFDSRQDQDNLFFETFFLHCTGSQLTVGATDEHRSSIERVRLYFLKNFVQKTNSSIALTPFTANYYYWNDFEDRISLKDWRVYTNKIESSLWNHKIEPYLPSMATSLGATYSRDYCKIEIDKGSGWEKRTIKKINIQWEPGAYFVYPIPPQEVLKTAPSDFYKHYIEQRLCDLTLCNEAKTKVQVHSLVFDESGGKLFKKSFDRHWEPYHNEVPFGKCSERILRLYVDFVYLGESALGEKVYRDEVTIDDLIDLLQLANYVDSEPLTLASANFLTLLAKTPEELEQVGEIAELFNNQHLKQFIALTQPPPIPESHKAASEET